MDFIQWLVLSLLIVVVAWAIGKGRTKAPPKRKCPNCAEWISPEAKVCPHCQRDVVSTTPVAAHGGRQ